MTNQKYLKLIRAFRQLVLCDRLAGINEPDIIFRNLVLNEDIKMEEYKRLVCLRYWNEIYVPFATFEETFNSGRVDDNDSYRLDYF